MESSINVKHWKCFTFCAFIDWISSCNLFAASSLFCFCFKSWTWFSCFFLRSRICYKQILKIVYNLNIIVRRKCKSVDLIMVTCASSAFNFWAWISCNFCVCPSELAERFSISANKRSLSCCSNICINKWKLFLCQFSRNKLLKFKRFIFNLHSFLFIL